LKRCDYRVTRGFYAPRQRPNAFGIMLRAARRERERESRLRIKTPSNSAVGLLVRTPKNVKSLMSIYVL
jgi:hypothetical protein